ncbi:hypothetical protein [Leifsonia poae]|uniref:DUF4232 domain-containing protein n=1 Tax=Leifsonia poae TaxID=110933 RepID=A0A9W6H7C3_9MICO|nr:hypothetical protein [Leifsonia poae]GLJ75321.1 hypothetical protein GCM10017584_08950 [Leifsonia poae]
MSTFKHPVGPQPSKVYWRRRLLVALGLLAVIVVIILIVVRPGSSSGTPAAVPTTSTTPKAATNPTSIPTTETTANGQPCTAANITVQAITDLNAYAAGQNPKLAVSITNHGTTSCKIDAGTSKQVFTITSGSEVYWKSTDCQTSKVYAEVLLQPGKTISSQTPITWDRTRSDPKTCQATRDQVPAGGASYHLQTSVAGIISDTTKQFSLN